MKEKIEGQKNKMIFFQKKIWHGDILNQPGSIQVNLPVSLPILLDCDNHVKNKSEQINHV